MTKQPKRCPKCKSTNIDEPCDHEWDPEECKLTKLELPQNAEVDSLDLNFDTELDGDDLD